MKFVHGSSFEIQNDQKHMRIIMLNIPPTLYLRNKAIFCGYAPKYIPARHYLWVFMSLRFITLKCVMLKWANVFCDV